MSELIRAVDDNKNLATVLLDNIFIRLSLSSTSRSSSVHHMILAINELSEDIVKQFSSNQNSVIEEKVSEVNGVSIMANLKISSRIKLMLNLLLPGVRALGKNFIADVLSMGILQNDIALVVVSHLL